MRENSAHLQIIERAVCREPQSRESVRDLRKKAGREEGLLYSGGQAV